jgi:hypothetical protein
MYFSSVNDLMRITDKEESSNVESARAVGQNQATKKNINNSIGDRLTR